MLNGDIALRYLTIAWGISEILLALLKRSGSASSRNDRGSLQLLWVTIVVGVFLGMFFHGWQLGAMPFPRAETVALGFILVVAGLLLRIAAIMTLKAAFTVDVATSSDQEVITRGVYRFMRHPSYSGMLLSFLGFGIGMHNWLSLAGMMLPLFLGLAYRIHVEESALAAAFGASYRDYAARTKRLIPFVL